MPLSQVSHDHRQRLYHENPDGPLPCCWHHNGEGCPEDATHWTLSAGLRWQAVTAVPEALPATPPTFCHRHADIVCSQRNARATPAPPARRNTKAKQR
jgi:hypothetical protein